MTKSWYSKYPWISDWCKIFCSTCHGAKQLGVQSIKRLVFTEVDYSKAKVQDHEKKLSL